MSAGAIRRAPPTNRRRVTFWSLLWQAVLLLAIVWLGWRAVDNAATNMQARNIPTNFDFWFAPAGFDINQSLIDFTSTSTYGQAFFVGLFNTLVVAAVGIVLATVLGFTIGIARLSRNWLTATLSYWYVEIIRNTPLLLQLLFWYNAVLKPLPGPRQSLTAPSVGLQMPAPSILFLAALCGLIAVGMILIARTQGKQSIWRLAGVAVGSMLALLAIAVALFGGVLLHSMIEGPGLLALSAGSSVFLNNRGLYLPGPVAGEGALAMVLALVVIAVLSLTLWFWSRRRQAETGQMFPLWQSVIAFALLAGAAAWFVGGAPLQFEYAQLRGFNLSGGLRVYPEFVALVLGLSLYTAAFIAEIVRAGVLAVSHGQSEAGLALGLRQSRVLRLIVIPQALRVVIPPLTNQYLNLTKNSSLAVFIGFPDLVQIFAGTVLNQTGAAVQVISITMAVYLTISLLTSLVMNVYNRRMALVER